MADTNSISYKDWAQQNPDEAKEVAAIHDERSRIHKSTHDQVNQVFHDSTGQAWQFADA